MKYIRNIITTVIFSSFVFFACQKDEVSTPDACFTLNDQQNDLTVKVGETVKITGCSSADFYSVWVGDLKHNYENRAENLPSVDTTKVVPTDFAYVVDKTTQTYNYIYTTPGTFTIVWIATNVGNDGYDVKSSIETKTITVE
jgi:hypothetical protein